MEFEDGLFSTQDLNLLTNLSYYPAGTYKTPAKIANGSNPYNDDIFNKYAYIAIDQKKAELGDLTLDLPYYVAAEGMNEHGLTISALVLQMSTYEKPLSKPTTISYTSIVGWALGNAKNIADLRNILTNDVAVASCADSASFADFPAAGCKFLPHV